VVAGALVAHGEAALAHFPPPAGGRVLDIGCGLGETTLRLAELVGPEGSVLGIDVAERMIGLARAEAAHLGIANVEYVDGDAQTHPFEGPFDYVMSIGPAAEVVRLWGERIDEMRPRIEAAVREALAEFEGPDGVVAAASTWSVSGTAPA